jgi:hypothetical protein
MQKRFDKETRGSTARKDGPFLARKRNVLTEKTGTKVQENLGVAESNCRLKR